MREAGAGGGRRPSGRSRPASHLRRTGSAHGPARQDRSARSGETFLLIRTYLEERRDEISVRDLDSATSICVTTVEALTHRVRHRQARCAGRRPRPVHRGGHAADRGLPDAGPAIALDRAAPEAHCCGTTPVVVEIVGTRKRPKQTNNRAYRESHHETPSSACGRHRRARSARCCARRCQVSRSHHPPHRAVPGRWRHRRRRPHVRRQADPPARPDRDRRQQERRGGLDRRHGGEERQARRLHAAGRDFVDARHQSRQHTSIRRTTRSRTSRRSLRSASTRWCSTPTRLCRPR